MPWTEARFPLRFLFRRFLLPGFFTFERAGAEGMSTTGVVEAGAITAARPTAGSSGSQLVRLLT